MVVSNSELASAAGAEIMKRGGNAVDAAVATGFALAVTYPFAGNIGGGGFMVIHMADGRAAAFDYREVAPLAASRDMYLDASGKLTNKSLVGGLAVGVPGSVAGMAAALAKYGTMSLHDVMQPAIRLASEGFAVDSALYRSINSSRRLIGEFAGAKIFLANGAAPAPGSIFKQPDLARTLTLIADQGPAAFYTGPIADKLVAEQKADGGIITKEDLARYKPIERVPIEGTYRGYRLFTMPPSSSGRSWASPRTPGVPVRPLALESPRAPRVRSSPASLRYSITSTLPRARAPIGASWPPSRGRRRRRCAR